MNNFVMLRGLGRQVDPSLLRRTQALVCRPDQFSSKEIVWGSRDGKSVFIGREGCAPTGFHADERGTARWLVGEPIQWRGEADCELVTSPRWRDDEAENYDGRFVCMSLDVDRGLRVFTDPLGLLPVYWVELDGALALSPNPGLLRSLVDHSSALDPTAVATLLALGFVSTDRTPVGGIHRISPSHNYHVSALDFQQLRKHANAPRLNQFESGLEPQRAARLLNAITSGAAAYADEHGLTLDVGLTAGRDSRLLLASLASQGQVRQFFTALYPTDGYYRHSPDARVAAHLADLRSMPHQLLDLGVLGEYFMRPAALLEEVARWSAGSLSVEDAKFVRIDRWSRRELVLGGSGAELARSYYGLVDSTDFDSAARSLHTEVVGSYPVPLTTAGRDLLTLHVRSLAKAWVDDGLPLRLLLERWYLHRDQRWMATLQGWANSFSRTVNPFLSSRLLPDLWGGTDADRASERFHRELIAALAPELATPAFFKGRWERWDVYPRTIKQGKLTTLAGKIAREGKRRIRATAFKAPLAAARNEVDCWLDSPGHDIWEVFDHKAIAALARKPLVIAHPAEERYLQRAGTIFSTLRQCP